MKILPCLALLSATALLLPGAQAQTQKIKPGLWEHRMALKSQSGQVEGAMAMAQAQLEAMSPEQRKMVEQMMAAQGVTLGSAGKLDTVRVCISKEQAERDELPQSQDCQQQTLTRSGNTLRMKFSCQTNPPASGEAEITLKGPTGYTGKALINTVLQGRKEQINADLTGTWLSAECGTAAPVGGR
ncbi:MAG: hypothetical protein RLY71_391 [Pseudomonadota bacterium]|jgi:hypothetical protein